MNKAKKEELIKLIGAFKGKRIAVVGDFMLDRYVWGSVSRISPEAPVPIVEIDHESEQLGGAANVAHNIASLGAQAMVFGVVGGDLYGKHLEQLMQQAGFDTRGIAVSRNRVTTIKTRVIADDQHVVRTDREARNGIDQETQDQILRMLAESMSKLDGIVLEDYNKGVLTRSLITKVISLANEHDKIITVDPKFDHFFDYRNVTVFKPNRKEIEEVLAVKLDNEASVRRAAEEVLRKLACQCVLLTLGSQGMLLLQSDGRHFRIPTKAKRVHDVSGAGDTVIATLTTALAAGAGFADAAVLANDAAGVVVGEVGAIPIEEQKLISAVLQQESS